ncbi:MAG: hypothetical protein LWW85_00995 [Marinilabiliales bacterium]|nr:hypothetical protein [Marinilabiliales bacterium]
MKSKVLNLLLLITSLFGYLEWGNHYHTFLIQAEVDVLSKLFADPLSVLHPLTVAPMIGQILLLITLFQKVPSRVLTFVSMGCLGLLLGLMLFIGVISLNFKIILSTLPFVLIAVWTILYHRKNKLG